MVQLVQAKQVSSGGGTFIKARVPDAKFPDSPIAFEPDQYWLKDSELQVEEFIFCANKDRGVQLLMANSTDSLKDFACGAIIDPFAKASLRDMLHGTIESMNGA